MIVFPNPREKRKICTEEQLLVFTQCFCPEGHNLITENAKFDEFDGILLRISNAFGEGYVALSSVYGCKTRVAVGIKLEEGDTYTLSCPKCKAELPVYTKCHCGGDIFVLFLDKEPSFDSFIGACSRIGCTNSYIQIGEEIITTARLEAL